jgi:hypothetical protein
MVERLILVKNCGDCPLKVWENRAWRCRQTGNTVGTQIVLMDTIPSDCPLMPASRGHPPGCACVNCVDKGGG